MKHGSVQATADNSQSYLRLRFALFMASSLANESGPDLKHLEQCLDLTRNTAQILQGRSNNKPTVDNLSAAARSEIAHGRVPGKASCGRLRVSFNSQAHMESLRDSQLGISLQG